MNQIAINFDRPALTPQLEKLYSRMLQGAIRTDEMRDELQLISHTKRVSELKRWLEPERTIEKEYAGNRLFEYKLIEVR